MEKSETTAGEQFVNDYVYMCSDGVNTKYFIRLGTTKYLVQVRERFVKNMLPLAKTDVGVYQALAQVVDETDLENNFRKYADAHLKAVAAKTKNVAMAKANEVRHHEKEMKREIKEITQHQTVRSAASSSIV